MKKSWVRGMIAGAMIGASAATVYGMMNWQTERKMARAAMNAGRAIMDKTHKMFG